MRTVRDSLVHLGKWRNLFLPPELLCNLDWTAGSERLRNRSITCEGGSLITGREGKGKGELTGARRLKVRIRRSANIVDGSAGGVRGSQLQVNCML